MIFFRNVVTGGIIQVENSVELCRKFSKEILLAKILPENSSTKKCF